MVNLEYTKDGRAYVPLILGRKSMLLNPNEKIYIIDGVEACAPSNCKHILTKSGGKIRCTKCIYEE